MGGVVGEELVASRALIVAEAGAVVFDAVEHGSLFSSRRSRRQYKASSLRQGYGVDTESR